VATDPQQSLVEQVASYALMINRDWLKATATAVFSAQAERERL
jgi:hypothetical protein